MADGHQSRHADVFGDREMVCRNSDKLTRHNNIVGALVIGSGLASLSAHLSNVLEMRRRLPCRGRLALLNLVLKTCRLLNLAVYSSLIKIE